MENSPRDLRGQLLPPVWLAQTWNVNAGALRQFGVSRGHNDGKTGSQFARGVRRLA